MESAANCIQCKKTKNKKHHLVDESKQKKQIILSRHPVTRMSVSVTTSNILHWGGWSTDIH